jgi:hypothetical protein
MVRSVSRGVALLFAIVLALASCGSPSYNRSAFRIECEEASGLFITGMADGEVQLGCPSLEIGLDIMNCGQAGADEAIRQLKVMGDGDYFDFDAIEDLCYFDMSSSGNDD